MKLINIGFGSLISADRLVAVVSRKGFGQGPECRCLPGARFGAAKRPDHVGGLGRDRQRGWWRADLDLIDDELAHRHPGAASVGE